VQDGRLVGYLGSNMLFTLCVWKLKKAGQRGVKKNTVSGIVILAMGTFHVGFVICSHSNIGLC